MNRDRAQKFATGFKGTGTFKERLLKGLGLGQQKAVAAPKEDKKKSGY